MYVREYPAYSVVRLDLSVSRNDVPFSVRGGGSITVLRCDGEAYIKLYSVNNEKIDIRMIRRITSPLVFYNFYVSNPPGLGELVLIVGKGGFDVEPSRQVEVGVVNRMWGRVSPLSRYVGYDVVELNMSTARSDALIGRSVGAVKVVDVVPNAVFYFKFFSTNNKPFRMYAGDVVDGLDGADVYFSNEVGDGSVSVALFFV